jgi:hypothetical protein
MNEITLNELLIEAAFAARESDDPDMLEKVAELAKDPARAAAVFAEATGHAGKLKPTE